MIRQAALEATMTPKQTKQVTLPREGFFTVLLKAAASANILLVAFVLLSLLMKTNTADLAELFTGFDTVSSILLSMVSVLLSAALVMVVGIPAAYYLSRARGKVVAVLEILIYLPMVFPPAVSGLALLAAFGRNSPVGQALDSIGVMLPFTFAGVVLTQAFVTLPIFVQTVKNGFASVGPAVAESARVFGAGDRQLLFLIYIPMAKAAILSGVIMSVLRAAGEFGATIMFAGNLVGRTQTVTTRIYTLFQQDIGQAACLAAIQIFVFIVPLFLLSMKYREARDL